MRVMKCAGDCGEEAPLGSVFCGNCARKLTLRQNKKKEPVVPSSMLVGAIAGLAMNGCVGGFNPDGHWTSPDFFPSEALGLDQDDPSADDSEPAEDASLPNDFVRDPRDPRNDPGDDELEEEEGRDEDDDRQSVGLDFVEVDPELRDQELRLGCQSGAMPAGFQRVGRRHSVNIHTVTGRALKREARAKAIKAARDSKKTAVAVVV